MTLPVPDQNSIAQVASLARTLHRRQFERLVAAVSDGKLSLSSGVLQIQHVVQIATADARPVASLFRSWQRTKGSEESLIAALLAARAAGSSVRAETPSVRLVWTGPVNASVPARSTISVLLDLIDRGQQEIVIVGYVITDAAAIIFKHLAAAQKRGVQVILISDRLEEKLDVLRSCWPHDQRLPALYSRIETPADPRSALHAKLAVVDQRHMLVTSANLTYHGLAGNIEIGMEIEGQIAAEVVALLNKLIAENICVRIYDAL
jgi:phosphatidylserine/phosphatidylglycerophosphate/cardiolipin synthase-like enzyme